MTEGYTLLFIDVDGVLNSTRNNKAVPFIPEIMARLARLVRESGAQPVLSTAWRLKEESRTRVIAQFLEYGLPMPLSCTPRILGPRGNEVLAWLQMNTENVLQDRELNHGTLRTEAGEFEEAQFRLPARIKVAQFAIIDDRDFRTLMHGGAHRHLLTERHFVHIYAAIGMQQSDADLVRLLLCGGDDQQPCTHCAAKVLISTTHPTNERLLFCDLACLALYDNKRVA